MKLYPTTVGYNGIRLWMQDDPTGIAALDYQVNTIGSKIVLSKAKDDIDMDYVEVETDDS